LHFLFDGGFAEGAAEGLVVKKRIVTEPADPAGLVDYASFDGTAKCLYQLAVVNQSDYADEACAPVLNTSQALEQQRIVGGIGRMVPGVPRRVDSGGSVECVDLQAGIVGEEIGVDVLSVGGGFLDGVGFKGVTGFIRRRDGLRECAHVEIGRGQLKFAQLTPVARGAVDDHAFSRDFWTRINSAIPTRASAISEASCSSLKAVFSAVA
jgi:hypothetical protein